MLDDAGYANFQRTIQRLIGVDLASYREGQMRRRLDALVQRVGANGYGGYARLLERDPARVQEFRDYFVVQTPAMLERYGQYVVPAVPLADEAAMARIGSRWALEPTAGPPYDGPTLVVAGRQDSVVGYAAAADLLDHYPRATLAVLDGAGHALPHEQPDALAALLDDWLARSSTRP